MAVLVPLSNVGIDTFILHFVVRRNQLFAAFRRFEMRWEIAVAMNP